jgi:hypothetical protein
MDTPRIVIRGLTAFALVCFASSFAQAGTIIKLSLGGTGPDVAFAAGVLGTANDGDAATTGNQDTAIDFTDFLSARPDITTNTASFTLGNLAATGSATVLGSLAIQNFAGGQFSLYDASNVLLLSGSLTNSVLTGTIGSPGTGALFTTTLANVTGGTLAPLIAPGSLSLALDLTNVNGGTGLGVEGPALLPFTADSSVNIAASVPEPASLTLLALGSAGAAFFGRRRRR